MCILFSVIGGIIIYFNWKENDINRVLENKEIKVEKE